MPKVKIINRRDIIPQPSQCPFTETGSHTAHFRARLNLDRPEQAIMLYSLAARRGGR